MKYLLSIPVLAIATVMFLGCSVNKKDEKQTEEKLTIKTDVCFYQTYNVNELDISTIQMELQNACDTEIYYYNHSIPTILSVQNEEGMFKIDEAFSNLIGKDILPKDFHYLWNYNKELNHFNMVGLKREPAIRNGIAKMDIGLDRDAGYYLDVEFDKETAKLWEYVTTDNVGRAIAIVVDDKVLSYPIVNSTITVGKVWITGNFNKKEIEELYYKITGEKKTAPLFGFN